VISTQVDIGLLAEALSIILAFVAYYFNGKYKKVKKTVKDIASAISTTEKALEDNKITQDELKQMLVKWRKVLDDIGG